MTEEEAAEALRRVTATLERHGLAAIVREVDEQLDAIALREGRGIDVRERLIRIVDAAIDVLALSESLRRAAPGLLTDETDADRVVVGLPDMQAEVDVAQDVVGFELSPLAATEAHTLERLRSALEQLRDLAREDAT